MTLKTKIEKLDDVEEPYRSLYVENEDGTYRLDAEGAEDVSGLKSALTKERESNKSLKDKLKSYEGVDTEKYHSLITEQEKVVEEAAKVTEQAAKASGKVDELIAQHEKEKAKLSDQHSKAYQTEKDKNTQLETELNEVLINKEYLAQIGDIAVDGVAARQLVALTVEQLERVDGEVRIKDGKGGHLNNDDGSYKGINDQVNLVKESEEYARLVKGSGASGSGALGDNNNGGAGLDNPWSKEHFNLTQQGQLVKNNPAKAEQLKAAANK